MKKLLSIGVTNNSKNLCSVAHRKVEISVCVSQTEVFWVIMYLLRNS